VLFYVFRWLKSSRTVQQIPALECKTRTRAFSELKGLAKGLSSEGREDGMPLPCLVLRA